VEPACAVLEISPSTYYAAKKREENPSARDERDEELKMAIMRAREKKGRRLYGAKKMWRELNRDGIEVARCTVERLMREMGLEGLRARKKRPRTTVPGPAGQERPSDLLERDFTAPAPNRRWVADITYFETSAGFVYAAFILDLFSRMIVG
jgi:putative transposase